MHEEEEEKTVKLFCLSRHRVEVIFSSEIWKCLHQHGREEKLLQRELHEHKYGYTVVEAPLFTAQKSASLIFDYVPLLIDANSLCQFGTSRRLRRCEWSEKRQSGSAREKEKVAAKLAPIDHLNSFRILCFIASAQNEKLTSTERAEKIDWWN